MARKNTIIVEKDDISFEERFCPFQQEDICCGDWCPLFTASVPITKSSSYRIILGCATNNSAFIEIKESEVIHK